MARVKSSVVTHHRHKRWLKRAKGYYGGRHRLYRTARVAVMRSLAYAYRDRRKKKRVFRSLWITRIGIALRRFDINYSTFIGGLKKAGITINRKVLAELAYSDPDQLRSLVMIAKENA
ncbi:50S ribosomal protein L20 [candidate division WOR-3 bacterium]|uniref:Large ribosomal subunit protein bL20 n=1 Tax=candidate division WOR-3 bacterium TaxID=2052148 RepID=A0A660SL64_UNCW3|nr:MAG: 50S ribosomal protein L20 [candidate division WOR-3 bacterium]